MARSIRTVLSPLLIISYICGLRIVEYPVGRTRPWLSYFYILLLWSIYCFLMIDFILFYIPHTWTRYKILILLHILTGFMSLFIRLYYDKVRVTILTRKRKFIDLDCIMSYTQSYFCELKSSANLLRNHT